MLEPALESFPFRLGPQPFPLLLQGQPLRDVPDCGRDQHPPLRGQPAQAYLGRELTAVAAQPGHSQPGIDGPGRRVSEVAGALGHHRRALHLRHEHLHRASHQVGGRVSEQPHGLGVHHGDQAVGGDGDHGVGGRVEQPPEPLLGLFPLAQGRHQSHAHHLRAPAQIHELGGAHHRDVGAVVPVRHRVHGVAQRLERP